MNDVKVIRSIKPVYNKDLIMSRLGYDKYRTTLSAETMREIERLIKKTEDIMDITAAYRITGITQINPPQIILEDGTILSGQMLSELLKNSRQALIMGATGGAKVMELIARLQEEGKMSEAVVIDAAASEITDSVLDFVMAMVEQYFRPKGMFLTKMRFSPGYGDFDIQQQKEFYRLLNAQDLGIMINEACLLIPEKSVFAIAGICHDQE
ncbi:MAG: methionine synthase [Clostridiaceae bacterium]|nr:methionine synthase [Clostridiaceae bacterium]